MKKLISIVIIVLIGLSLLPTILSMTDDEGDIREDFIAVGTVSDEVITLTYDPVYDLVTGDVIIDGVELAEGSAFIQSGKTVTINVSAYDTGDLIEISYIYELDYSETVLNMMSIIPTIYILVIVGGIVIYIKKN